MLDNIKQHLSILPCLRSSPGKVRRAQSEHMGTHTPKRNHEQLANSAKQFQQTLEESSTLRIIDVLWCFWHWQLPYYLDAWCLDYFWTAQTRTPGSSIKGRPKSISGLSLELLQFALDTEECYLQHQTQPPLDLLKFREHLQIIIVPSSKSENLRWLHVHFTFWMQEMTLKSMSTNDRRWQESIGCLLSSLKRCRPLFFWQASTNLHIKRWRSATNQIFHSESSCRICRACFLER